MQHSLSFRTQQNKNFVALMCRINYLTTTKAIPIAGHLDSFLRLNNNFYLPYIIAVFIIPTTLYLSKPSIKIKTFYGRLTFL